MHGDNASPRAFQVLDVARRQVRLAVDYGTQLLPSSQRTDNHATRDRRVTGERRVHRLAQHANDGPRWDLGLRKRAHHKRPSQQEESGRHTVLFFDWIVEPFGPHSGTYHF